MNCIELRWRERCGTFVLPHHVFRKRHHEVALLADDTTAKRFVVAHHYSKSYPAAQWRVGLYGTGGQLVGVAVFSVPVRAEVLAPFPRGLATELGRFVLLDEVGYGGETYFLTRCMELLVRETPVAGFVSFSDPFPRTRRDGETVFAGHVGGIYQKKAAHYLGQARAHFVDLLDDGRILSPRAVAKVRARDRGWEYVVGDLIEAGARPPADTATPEALATWLTAELPRITRHVKHPGNHKYAFPIATGRLGDALGRDLAKTLAEVRPYPRLPVPRCVPTSAYARAA